MSRCLLAPLSTAILALFLLGFPCRSMMLYAQASTAPAHDCCGDCDDAPQAPSQGCQTLCVASAAQVLQSAQDSTIGVPADCGSLNLIAPEPRMIAGAAATPPARVVLGSPPLYLQHASLLI